MFRSEVKSEQRAQMNTKKGELKNREGERLKQVELLWKMYEVKQEVNGGLRERSDKGSVDDC